MTETGLTYYRTAERPDLRFWLLDDDGALVDLTGHTLVFKLGAPGKAAVFTKTTGLTAAAGSGTEGSGSPNVTVTFAADELDDLASGLYRWEIRATTTGLDRIYQGRFYLRDVILDATP